MASSLSSCEASSGSRALLAAGPRAILPCTSRRRGMSADAAGKFAKVLVAGIVAFLCGIPLAAQQYDQRLFSEMRWRCIGPFRGGRTVAITGVPHQPNVFYMAAVNGGVWKTTDSGNTWQPIFDDQDTGSVGAIAVAPSDPKNPNRIFIAVEGHPYGPNEERGVFRSTDGGQSFQKILYKDENIGAADLAFDPGNPQTIYAVLWAARVAPWEIRSGESFVAKGSGLHKSTDGGTTWRQLTKGLPSSDDGGLGRIGIAVASTQPNRVYASVEAKKNAGVYRSDDAGESWQLVNSDQRIGGRGPGAMGIAVSPDNPDLIYVANTTTWKSSDAGKTFVGFKGAPGGDDYQRIWISGENPDIIALSSDQG